MSRLPPKHQTLLFSATMPKEIEDLAAGYLNNPVTVKVNRAVSFATMVAVLDRQSYEGLGCCSREGGLKDRGCSQDAAGTEGRLALQKVSLALG